MRESGVSVEKLEQLTKDLFSDKGLDASKRQYLKEIFNVARMLERFRNGEIGEFFWHEGISTSSQNIQMDRPLSLLCIPMTDLARVTRKMSLTMARNVMKIMMMKPRTPKLRPKA